MTTIADLEEMLDKDKTVDGKIKMEGKIMAIILKGFLSDNNGKDIKIGDNVENAEGQSAVVKFGQYEHHIGEVSSPAYGIYFDGDDGFYFSEHLLENGKVDVKNLYYDSYS